MNYLSAENICKTLNHKTLLKDVGFGLNHGDKVAVVGANGAGKSTFLKILAGLERPDTGVVSVRKDLRLGFQSQESRLEEGKTVFENLFHASHPMVGRILEYEHLIAGTSHTAEEETRIQQLTTELNEQNGWDFEARVREIMGKLHLQGLENQRAATLSGGQKKRVAMAKVLLMEPDILILDEPTNHLDTGAIEWLEELISRRFHTLILVTHDRYFMDRVCNQIVEIQDGGLTRYKGGYSYYLEKRIENQEVRNAEIGKARNRYRRELEWIRRQPKARGTKARYRVDAFEETRSVALQKTEETQLQLTVKQVRQGGKVLQMKKVNFDLGGRRLVRDFTHLFMPGEKVGIIGPNGAGKTSFIRLMTGEYTQTTGDIDRGENTCIGYYSQESDELKPGKKIIEMVSEVADVIEMADGSNLTASQFLTQFHFPPPAQQQKIENLSGGERRRVQLMMTLLRNPNLLILDEPSNDFDINTLHVLEEFLTGFPGTLVLVSHDRFLLDKLVDHLFVFEGDGKIRDFPGNYSQWKDRKEQEDEQKREEARRSTPAPAPAPAGPENGQPQPGPAKLTFKEKKELEELDARLPELEKRKAEIESSLSSGTETDPDRIRDQVSELENITRELDEKSLRWLELSDRPG